MIKIAFFDFDGTLVERDYSKLPDSTVTAMAALRAHGVSLWLCTGRADGDMPDFVMGEIAGLGPLDGYVCFSGSRCFDAEGTFYSCDLDRRDVASVVGAVREGRFDVIVTTPDGAYLSRKGPAYEELERRVGVSYPVRDVEDALGQDVVQMCAFVPPEDDDEVDALLAHSVTFRWSELFCDIVPAQSGKGRGVEAALEHLGLTADEAIAFGDGGNDIPMFRACGTSVALGHASADAKAAATYVTTPVDDDGIYRACVALGLIEDSLGLGVAPVEGDAGATHG